MHIPVGTPTRWLGEGPPISPTDGCPIQHIDVASNGVGAATGAARPLFATVLLPLVNGGDVKGLALRVGTRLGHGSRLAIRGNHNLYRRPVFSLQRSGGLQGIRIDSFVRQPVGVGIALEWIVLAVVLRLELSVCRFAVRTDSIHRILDAIVAPRFDLQGLALRRRAGAVIGFRQIELSRSDVVIRRDHHGREHQD